jgi:hypothetical protein
MQRLARFGFGFELGKFVFFFCKFKMSAWNESDDTNKEVGVDLDKVNKGASMGKFSEQWVGKWNKKESFKFSVAFSDDNRKATVHYRRAGAKHTDESPQIDELNMSFDVISATKLDAKLTFVLQNGAGTWRRADRPDNELALDNEALTCFVIGPEMTFCVTMPHILLHECGERGTGLKPRRLRRPLVIKW